MITETGIARKVVYFIQSKQCAFITGERPVDKITIQHTMDNECKLQTTPYLPPQKTGIVPAWLFRILLKTVRLHLSPIQPGGARSGLFIASIRPILPCRCGG
jgi:hypothetical protein